MESFSDYNYRSYSNPAIVNSLSVVNQQLTVSSAMVNCPWYFSCVATPSIINLQMAPALLLQRPVPSTSWCVQVLNETSQY